MTTPSELLNPNTNPNPNPNPNPGLIGKSRVPVKLDGKQHLWWLNNNVVVSIDEGKNVPVKSS